jgi:protein-S-isoprenylcysteine O-methyltransferase Ste14
VQSLAVGGFDAAVLAYTVAAATLVTLILVSAVIVTLGRDAAVGDLRSVAPRIKRWAGWVLVGVGGWFVLLAVFSEQFVEVFPV